MNIIKKYYIYISEILKEDLPFIPKLEITYAKGYYGRYVGSKKIIRVSTWNHIDSEWLMDEEDRLEIIDTICHELAHIFCNGHENDHYELNEKMKKQVIKIFRYLGFLKK